ncbi:GspH/FimT family pseudopilin [Marinobacter orientalis]|uniref:Type II secretion system protein H n=1 Tax=Marinobacter orientalis TaxID=1928859 RepID=A0A7Y0RFZ1_9GAMM|nr:prepilin-type N-terminal cleavage/methylation domain-containing protein [Marinobacter orientalis]TGX47144.1 prepilin-type N-terminal cleavage/methylation domain-containing protein [Marinobacter orientalis]
MQIQQRFAGFTLPELVVTIAILGIVSSLAAQGWSSASEHSRHRTILETYHSFFAFARWTAVSKRSLVTICPLSEENKCVDEWERPVSVFVDANNDKQPDNGEVLKKMQPVRHPFTMRSRTAGRGYFQLNEEGFAYGSPGSLVLCPANPTTGTMTYMAVNMTGRFRVQSDEDGDGIIQLRWGARITC